MTKQEAKEFLKYKLMDTSYISTEFNYVKDVFNIAIECIEKQIPRNPIWRWDGNETIIECPNCGKYPFDMSEYEWARQFCGNCGQAIDWSDNE